MEPEGLDRRRLVGGLDDTVAVPRQHRGEHVSQVVVVVDQEDVGSLARHGPRGGDRWLSRVHKH